MDREQAGRQTRQRVADWRGVVGSSWLGLTVKVSVSYCSDDELDFLLFLLLVLVLVPVPVALSDEEVTKLDCQPQQGRRRGGGAGGHVASS